MVYASFNTEICTGKIIIIIIIIVSVIVSVSVGFVVIIKVIVLPSFIYLFTILIATAFV